MGHPYPLARQRAASGYVKFKCLQRQLSRVLSVCERGRVVAQAPPRRRKRFERMMDLCRGSAPASKVARGTGVLSDSKTRETFTLLRQIVPGVPGIKGDGASHAAIAFHAQAGADQSLVAGVPITYVRPRSQMEAHRGHSSQVIDRGFRGSVFAVLDAGQVHLAVRKRMLCGLRYPPRVHGRGY